MSFECPYDKATRLVAKWMRARGFKKKHLMNDKKCVVWVHRKTKPRNTWKLIQEVVDEIDNFTVLIEFQNQLRDAHDVSNDESGFNHEMDSLAIYMQDTYGYPFKNIKAKQTQTRRLESKGLFSYTKSKAHQKRKYQTGPLETGRK